MKQFAYLFVLVIAVAGCKKEDLPTEKTYTPDGFYIGTYSECGATYCGTKDTTFSITKSGADYYFDFGFIHEQVTIATNGDMRSSQVEWFDSSHTTGYYPITGAFLKDSMFVHIASKYLLPTVYKNELKGFKQH